MGERCALDECEQCALDESILSSIVLRGYFAFGDSCAVKVSDVTIQISCEQIESGITIAVFLCTESRYAQMAEHAVRHIHDSSGYATLALYRDLYVLMKWDGADANKVVYGSSHVSQHSCRKGT